jgi:hypothetical protein
VEHVEHVEEEVGENDESQDDSEDLKPMIAAIDCGVGEEAEKHILHTSGKKQTLFKILRKKNSDNVILKVRGKVNMTMEVEAMDTEKNIAAMAGDGSVTLWRFGRNGTTRGDFSLRTEDKVDQLLLEPIKGDLFVIVLTRMALDVYKVEMDEDKATDLTGTAIFNIPSPTATFYKTVTVDRSEGTVYLLDTKGVVRQTTVSKENFDSTSDVCVPVELHSLRLASIFFRQGSDMLYMVTLDENKLLRAAVRGSFVTSVEEVRPQ